MDKENQNPIPDPQKNVEKAEKLVKQLEEYLAEVRKKADQIQIKDIKKTLNI